MWVFSIAFELRRINPASGVVLRTSRDNARTLAEFASLALGLSGEGLEWPSGAVQVGRNGEQDNGGDQPDSCRPDRRDGDLASLPNGGQ